MAIVKFLYCGSYQGKKYQNLLPDIQICILAEDLRFRQLECFAQQKVVRELRRLVTTDRLEVEPLVEALRLLYDNLHAEIIEVQAELQLLYSKQKEALWASKTFQALLHSGLGGGQFAEDVTSKDRKSESHTVRVRTVRKVQTALYQFRKNHSTQTDPIAPTPSTEPTEEVTSNKRVM